MGAVVLLSAAASGARASDSSAIRIGSKKFTENVVLGEIAAQLMQAEGEPVRHRRQLGGTRVLWEALTHAEIDVYPEYTGTIDQELFPDRRLESVAEIRRALESRGISMTKPIGFENTYALAMKRSRAEELGIDSISDLVVHPDLTLGFTNEFMDRKDGWPGLRRHYGLPHRDVQGMDHDLAYRGLESGDVDVIDVYTTDAEIEYYDLKLLEDDRDFFPSYRAVYLYRSSLESRAPGAVRALRRMEGALDASRMSRLNRQVKIEERSEDAVAAAFVQRQFGIETTVRSRSWFDQFAARTREHLFLVAISLFAAIAVAVPLGVWSAVRPGFGQVILGAVGILQTIPSLALLVLMIPLFGIGNWPAIAALFVYSLLPIVRNTYSGLRDIPREIRDSARAVGLSRWAMLRRIELPMATRSILAGIKTSAVINIGVATLGALVGAGGYGQPILTGIRLDDTMLILSGAVPAAVLALLAQGVFELVERAVLPRG
ncbi:MAG: glycine betaine ABC transporter substrate-binding protein, partial [Bradymonadaceae bacterium]